MRNRLLVTLLSLLPILVFSQKNTAQLEWITGPELELGTVAFNTITKVQFKFKNIDTVQLTIETVRTTCSCTAVDWQKEPIMPGETVVLPISFSPNLRGGFDKTIRLYFFEKKKMVKMSLRGEVED